MLEKAIRKAALSILLNSLMVGAKVGLHMRRNSSKTTESKVATDDTFCAGTFCSFNGGQYRHCNLRKRFGYQAKSSEYYKDYDVNPDFRCVGEWYTENG